MTTEQIRQLAESKWANYGGSEERLLWINGFMIGYLNAQIDSIDNKIEVVKKETEKV